jgi:hypothetical protein
VASQRTEHSDMPVSPLKCPAAQSMHAEALLLAEYVPTVQFVHSDAAAPENAPSPHGAGVTVPLVHLLPAGQG